MRMKAREVIRVLEADGWAEVRVTGSHHHFKHLTRPGLVTVPMHGSADVKLAVLRSIEKQSGLKLRKEG